MIADVSRLSARQRAALLARLHADPRVEAAGPNLWFKLQGEAVPATAAIASGARMTPNDPRYGEQWGFQMIGMPAAWEKATGKGAVVAVIDTGCAYEKMKDVPAASDLKGKYVDAYDFITNSKRAYDDHGHGSHVAGTIAQSTNNKHGVAGIAYDATIMPLKVLTAKGYGNLSDIADAIKYAADHGANVINMSLGGPTGHPVLRKAVTYAHQKGVTIVCAAGNGMGEGVGYPAAYPECIAVSSVGPSGELAWYSSYGKEVALAAPGGEYRSADEASGGILQNTVFNKHDTFEFWQGTSMASPHVAGVAALIYESGIKTPEAIRNRLRSTATPKGDELRYGAGVLNAAAAVGASDAGQTVRVAARPVDCRGACGLAAWLLLLGGCVTGYSLGRLGFLALTRRLR
jgi:serine protease